MSSAPKNLAIAADEFNEMIQALQQKPVELLRSPVCRKVLARKRWQKRGGDVVVAQAMDSAIKEGALKHNMIGAETFGSSARPDRLLYPLCAINDVWFGAAKMKILSVGPRTEMELFSLMGAGFDLNNISALDLFSNSPWITEGDMHAMPYSDSEFDALLAGWVITYSNDPAKAAKEMVRVVRNGGYIAVGVSFNAVANDPNSAVAQEAKEQSGMDTRNWVQTVDQLLGFFGDHVGRVYFQDDVSSGQGFGQIMAVFAVKK